MARKIAEHVFKGRKVTPEQLFGLSKLAWITVSHIGESAGYIRSTKIPALSAALGLEIDRDKPTLAEMAIRVADAIGDETVKSLILKHTGFTNFYSAYRNSALDWVKENHAKLLPMYKAAFLSRTLKDRLKIIEKIENLPCIPKANTDGSAMKAEYFLTPAFFVLDPDIRFPIVNGRKTVQNLLRVLEVKDASLVAQFSAMSYLYGKGGIKDAADIDQVGGDAADFVSTKSRPASKQLLAKRKPGDERNLPLKDEADLHAFRDAMTMKHRRIHNELTNKLRDSLKHFTLFEGKTWECKYDVLVKHYDNKNDLLIEVKSSAEVPHIRMAVGQLFHYAYEYGREQVGAKGARHLAFLAPSRPEAKSIEFLKWMDIGVFWYEGDHLCSATKWLAHLVA
jgi:hypothetical protein